MCVHSFFEPHSSKTRFGLRLPRFFRGWVFEVGRFTRLDQNSAKSNLEVPLLKRTISSIAMKNGTPFVFGNVLCEVTLATSEDVCSTDVRCLQFACVSTLELLFP